MKRAYELAQQNKARVALIDRPITQTMQRLTKGISWKEKWNFFVDVVKGTTNYLLGKKAELPFDLRTVPSEELITSLIATVKDRYPNVYRVLVEERNDYMARKLSLLRQHFPEDSIFAIVGAGHVTEMIALLKKYDDEHEKKAQQ